MRFLKVFDLLANRQFPFSAFAKVEDMRDWYMENGEYASVDRGSGMAYDSDNDAWTELGSTPGSTPFWWRWGRDEDDFGEGEDISTRQEKAALLESLRKSSESALKEAKGKLASLNEEIQRRREKNAGDTSLLSVFISGMLGLGGICSCMNNPSATLEAGMLWILFLAWPPLYLYLDHRDRLKLEIDLREKDQLEEQVEKLERDLRKIELRLRRYY